MFAKLERVVLREPARLDLDVALGAWLHGLSPLPDGDQVGGLVLSKTTGVGARR